jgi:DNA-binding NarL/FixJ family response regulator
MVLVGVATSGRGAVRLFREHRPEVVLMDLDLPESNGVRAILEIRELDRTVCIFGLFTHPWDERAALALRAGARACIAKDRLNRELLTLIRECPRPGA